MDANLSGKSERTLVEATQRLSAEERIHAFLVHSRLIMELHEAGRQATGPRAPPDLARLP